MGRGKGLTKNSKILMDSKEVLFSSRSLKPDRKVKVLEENEAEWLNEIQSANFIQAVSLKSLKEFNSFEKEHYKDCLEKFKKDLTICSAKEFNKPNHVDQENWDSLKDSFRDLVSCSCKTRFSLEYHKALHCFQSHVDKAAKAKAYSMGRIQNQVVEYKIKKVSLATPDGKLLFLRPKLIQSIFKSAELLKQGEKDLTVFIAPYIKLRLEDPLLDKEYQKEIDSLLKGNYIEKKEVEEDNGIIEEAFFPTKKSLELYEINAAYIDANE